MDVDEDGGYSDDDLDALPNDTFQRLQEHAITSTQQGPKRDNAPYPSAVRPQKKAPGALASGFERLSVDGDLGYQEDLDFPHQPSSDYGDLDDEMLDGEIYDAAEEPGVNAIQASRAANLSYGESTQRELWRKQRYGKPPAHLDPEFAQARAGRQLQNGINDCRQEVREAEMTLSNTHDVHHDRQSDVDALQAQILEVRSL